MFNQVESKKQLAPKAERIASRVALDQGLEWGCEGESRSIKLGRQRVGIKDVALVHTVDGSRRWAPPRVVKAVDPEAFTEGTLDELRCRLAAITALEGLLGEDVGIHEVAAALDFLRDSGVHLPIDHAVVEIDFLAWRVLTGDLDAWFDLRFVCSRITAV